jgi:hypothetical protein
MHLWRLGTLALVIVVAPRAFGQNARLVPISLSSVPSTSPANLPPNANGIVNPASCATYPSPSWCSGSDIGAWVNAAASTLPTGGRIYIPAGNYNWTTPIVFSTSGACPVMEGAGQNATTLNWAGSTSATAITFNCAVFSKAGGILPGHGLRDIAFFNTVPPGTTVGLMLGGTNGAYGWFGHGITVSGFNINLEYGSNTWNTLCVRCNFDFPGTSNLYIPSSITNSGESIQFVNTSFDNSTSSTYKTSCIHNSLGDLLTFVGGSFDNCQFVQDAGTGNTVLMGVNQEDPSLTTAPGASSYYGIVSSGSVRIVGGTFLQDESTGTPPREFWRVTGGSLSISGTWASNSNAASMLLASASGSGSVMFDIPSVGGSISYPFWSNSGSGIMQGRDQLGNVITNGAMAPAAMDQSAADKYAGLSACVDNTKTITLPIKYNRQPVIIVFDETTKGGANLSARSTRGFTVSCAGASDVFDWEVIGNPN